MKLPSIPFTRNCCSILAAMFASSSTHAADGTWNGISGNWTDTTDPGGVWSGGIIADGVDSTAFFTGVDISADQTITLNGNRTIGNLTFTDASTSSHNLTISGDSLTFERTTGISVVGVTQAGRTLSIASIIAGNDGLEKSGAGIMRLIAANIFTGGLGINAGTVFLNPASNANPLGSGKVTIGDVADTGAAAELLYSGTNGNNSFSNLIDVRGNGAATLRVIGYNPTFSGAVNLGNNLTVISNNSFGSNIGITGGVTGTGNLVIRSNAANGTASSAITFSTNPLNMTGSITNSGTTTSMTASNTTISAVIGTNVTEVIQNSTNSQLILTGANTFAGNILISAGTLQANRLSGSANPTSGALGNTQALGRTATISSGGTLNFSSGDVMGNGGSSPKLTLIANGGTIRNNSSSNYFNVLGPVQLNGGTLSSFGGGSADFPSFALTGGVTVGGSAVSTISTNGSNSQIGLQNAGTTFDVADAVSGSDLNVTGVLASWNSGTGLLIKTGDGTMTLSGVNTYTGGTRIDNGSLALGANNALPAAPVVIGAGTLNAATFDDATIGTLDVSSATSTINLDAGANLAFAASNAVDWTGGTLNLTGTLDFSGTASSSLRFGTTSSGLTAGQLSQIASPGWTNFALNSSGYLTATSSGGNYLSWATANNVTGGPNGDHDNDGVDNLVEYALVDGGERGVFSGNNITFTKRGNPYGSDITYIIEISQTLAANSWSPAVTHGPAQLGSPISHTFTPGTPAKNFARLKVTSP